MAPDSTNQPSLAGDLARMFDWWKAFIPAPRSLGAAHPARVDLVRCDHQFRGTRARPTSRWRLCNITATVASSGRVADAPKP